MHIISVTGHRPNSLGGYPIPSGVYNYLSNKIKKAFEINKADRVIVGMALGVDQIAAKCCIDLGIPFVAAVPFKGQENKWSKAYKKEYQSLLDKAKQVVYTSSGGFAAWKMFFRNEWMVNNSDKVLAVWNKVEKGGTYHAVSYARGVGKPIIFVDISSNNKEFIRILNQGEHGTL